MVTLKPISLPLETLKFQKIRTSNPNSAYQICNSYFPCKSFSSSQFDSSIEARRMVEEFNPKIPLQEALTPPSSWYTEPSFHELELDRVFYRGWQAVGYTEQIKNPQDFFTGRLGSVQFVVCRDANGKVHAFHNVCRHHASLLASGSGQKSCFVCPYHGWTYGLDGVLLKATRISGIRNFKVNEFGLIPIQVATWGPFILVNLDEDTQHQQNSGSKMVENEWLGSSSEILNTGGIDSSLSFVCRREYAIDCNWKVFCDNYLDGGYHVPYAHTGLASSLKLDSYSTTLFEKVSIQACESGSEQKGDDFDRLGSEALYAFIYPNFMINRYGPWMDTNLVLPLGPSKCQVIFDYFLEASLKFWAELFYINHNIVSRKFLRPPIPKAIAPALTIYYEVIELLQIIQDDKAFINQSLEESERVQMEDIALCEGVQKGLESPAYSCGRYAPTVEKAMHHFHCLLYETLAK